MCNVHLKNEHIEIMIAKISYAKKSLTVDAVSEV